MSIDANQIIDAIGGTSVVAELCEVTTGAVSQWRETGIPKARLMYLKLARPDVFCTQQSTSQEPRRSA